MKLELIRDESTSFPDIDNPKKYNELRIWHCKYRSFEKVALFRNLEKLEIATYPNINFEYLSELKKLRYLDIIHLPKIKDLSGISQLTSLEEIRIATLPSWDSSGKKSLISSLMPFRTLNKLKKLELLSVLPVDGNFIWLAECKSLREFNLQKKPSAGIESLKVLHELRPALKGSFLRFIK